MNILNETARRVRDGWRDLFVTDLIFKLFSFVALTPLLSLCQRLTIQLAGDGLLSDADFFYLFTRPVGIACGILVTAVWLGIMGLEQASLLAILGANRNGKRLRAISAIGVALRRAPSILTITGLLVATSLLVLLPVALATILVYRGLLGEFDINFYLNEKPSEFMVATGIGAVLVFAGFCSLVWLHSAWIFSVPITLFQRESPLRAMRASRHTLRGQRGRVIRWITTWVVIVAVAHVALATLGGWAGGLLLPHQVGSLVALATRVGILLLILAGLLLLVNLFATVTFASLTDAGYVHLRGRDTPIVGDGQHRDAPTAMTYPLTRVRLAAMLGIGLLFAAWIGLRTLESIPLDNDVLVMAHRGASAEAPENTLAAFQLAINQGAEWIEIDVQETADGEVIVMHDSDFMKQARHPLRTWDATLDDLATIDIGSWFDDKFADQRVATLAEVLKLCRNRVGVNIELKYYGHDEQLEQRVVDIVESAGMAANVMVMSLKKQGISKIKALRPRWKCGLLLSVYAGNLKNVEVDFLAINRRFASRSFVRRAHAAGKEVYVWTVNDAATMSQMLNRGVDGLLTDRPGLAKRVLAERAEMNLPERLLSEVSVWLLGNRSRAAVSP